jgi:hypothetical protein
MEVGRLEDPVAEQGESTFGRTPSIKSRGKESRPRTSAWITARAGSRPSCRQASRVSALDRPRFRGQRKVKRLLESTLRGYFREFVESLPERLVAALSLPRDSVEQRIVELPGIAPRAEERIGQACRSLKGVETIRAFQAAFGRALQDPFCRLGDPSPTLERTRRESAFRAGEGG